MSSLKLRRKGAIARHEEWVATTGAVDVFNYDAFGDITGNQSRSMAFLDSRGSGVVLSVLVGRSEMLFYTKQIKGGQGTEQLSPEEQSAIDKAMGR